MILGDLWYLLVVSGAFIVFCFFASLTFKYFLVVSGILWFLLVLSGTFWYFMELSGTLWFN